MPARIIGEIRVEVIFHHVVPNATAALVVPAEVQDNVEQQMRTLLHRGLDRRFTVPHPETEEQTVAFMPLPPGRVRMLQDLGIRYEERFLAVFTAVEKPYGGHLRREMWLTDAERLAQLVA